MASSQYFDPSPSTGSAERTVLLTLPDLRLSLTTDRGVFSADGVDAGTKLLLLDGPAAIQSDRAIIDLGCGYGPIALTLATRNPQALVWAIDVNARARELCRRNAAALGLDNVRVVAPDEVPHDLVADRIWSNPPIRIGKAALHELLTTWLSRLPETGSAHLVVQKHLGADSLHAWLEGEGWLVERRRSRKAFRLLDVSRADEPARVSPPKDAT